MAPLPPAWMRRGLVHPLFWLASLALVAGALPMALLAVAVASTLLRRPGRLLRLLVFAWAYLAIELLVIPCAWLSWLASGCGLALRRPAFVALHYRLFACVVALLVWLGSRLFALALRREAPLPAIDPTTETHRPLLVLSRHAGPGDSLLLIHQLFVWARRRPRIVAKHTLQWDPMIDLVFNRLPMVFIDPQARGHGAAVAGIEGLATTMAPHDALLIFPEGCKVTPSRRRRAIDRLWRAGRVQAARRAERMAHLMPPRTRGVRAALRARLDLDVVVVAHTGLDHLNTAREWWRAVPRDKTLSLQWRALPAADVPRDAERLAGWVFAQWELMDAWVGARRGVQRGLT